MYVLVFANGSMRSAKQVVRCIRLYKPLPASSRAEEEEMRWKFEKEEVYLYVDLNLFGGQ